MTTAAKYFSFWFILIDQEDKKAAAVRSGQFTVGEAGKGQFL